MAEMHELVAGLPLVTALAVAGLSVPLWLTARPLSARRRVMSLVCPASQVAVVALTYAAARVGLIMEASALAVAALSLVCVALDVRVVRALVEAEGADAARQRVQAAQEQLSAQREHLRTLARAQGEASELRGRTAGMFAAVAAALARGERDRALEMLREGEELAASPVRVPCANPVAAALLSAKAARCDALGIAWRCRCELPERLGFPSAELCALLSNLLDNAIEAARACGREEAFVRSVIRVSHGFLSVCVENSYDGAGEAGERETGAVLPEHGWGMQIVDTLVRARDGELTLSHADGVWSVHAIARLD